MFTTSSLVIGNSYLATFTKKDGSERTMLFTVPSDFSHEKASAKNMALVFDLEKQEERYVNFNTLKQLTKATVKQNSVSSHFRAPTSDSNTSKVCLHVQETKKPVGAKYSVKKHNGCFFVSLDNVVVGKVYSINQAERLIEFHSKWKRK